MSLPLFIVDAFTARPFGGNPAAVCLLDGPRDDAWMQRVAAEMNLSETAFLLPEGKDYRLRWFTPQVEVDLCGHATLASAHVLWQTGRCSVRAALRFLTRSGRLSARKTRGWIEMDFPAFPVASCEQPPVALGKALGAELTYVGRYGSDYLCEVADEKTLRELRPDFRRLKRVPTRGVIVTAEPAQSGPDFVSRFFAPAVGIPEDPVTGSAHCALGPYWAAKLGRTELIGFQASARGGIVRVRIEKDRVQLGGQAVTVLHGEFLEDENAPVKSSSAG
jgi:predicted PhzF superfamily epimerase YddE/YHI9